jgi:Protein of unknown function (DUF2867)
MRLPLAVHMDRPWKVHELARDFQLDEVWEFPIEADESKGETFRLFCAVEDRASFEPLPGPAEWLVRLRLFLDRLGLERVTTDRAIPGCREVSVRDRMKDPAPAPVVAQAGRFPFRIVYDDANERLLELSNATVHALLHLGWTRKRGTIFAPVMAVYVKPRGNFGRAYMALIYWFRVLIVYPAIMRATRSHWERWRSANAT